MAVRFRFWIVQFQQYLPVPAIIYVFLLDYIRSPNNHICRIQIFEFFQRKNRIWSEFPINVKTRYKLDAINGFSSLVIYHFAFDFQVEPIIIKGTTGN